MARGNLWIEGTTAFEEFDWIGRRLRIGQAVLKVEKRITRCAATQVNPETGHPDADTLTALKAHYGHRDFGIYAVVTEGGTVNLNDKVTLL